MISKDDIQRSIRDSAEATQEAVGHVRTAADAIHADLTALATAVNTGFAELRRRLDQSTAELADARRQIEALRADTAERATRPPQLPAAPRSSDTTDDYHNLLQRAAGTTCAELLCHRDTWDFLVTQSASGEHFRLPGEVDEGNGCIEAAVSGRTLTAVIDALWLAKEDVLTAPGTRALAIRAYERITEALQDVHPVDTAPAATEGDDGERSRPMVRIVIDDRPA